MHFVWGMILAIYVNDVRMLSALAVVWQCKLLGGFMARDEIEVLVERIQSMVKHLRVKVSELQDYTRHADARVRTAAFRGLWDFPSSESLVLLLKAAESDPNPEAQAAACQTLGRWIWAGLMMDERLDPTTGMADGIRLGDVETVRAHLKKIHGNPEQSQTARFAAFKSLCYDAQAEEHELIQKYWKNEDVQVRIFALECMGRTSNRRWQELILSTLYSTNRQILLTGMEAAAEACIEKAEARLLELALGQDRELALAAIWALRNVLHSPHARRALERMSRGKDPELKLRAREALADLDAIDLVESPDVDDD